MDRELVMKAQQGDRAAFAQLAVAVAAECTRWPTGWCDSLAAPSLSLESGLNDLIPID